MWDRALFPAEAAKHSNLTIERARYLFDEREGATTKDEVSGANATLSGGVAWAGTPDDPDDPNHIPTSADKWARFDSTGHVTGPRPANLRTDRSFTLTAWVRRGRAEAEGTVLGLGDEGFGLLYRSDIDRWAVRLGGDVLLGNLPTGAEWTHLAIAFDSATGTAVFYVDGVAQLDRRTGLQLADVPGDLVVGRGFTGAIDDPRVFSGALDLGSVVDVCTSTTH